MKTMCTLPRTVLVVATLALSFSVTTNHCPAQHHRHTVPGCSCSGQFSEDCAGCRAFRQQMESGVVPSEIDPSITSPSDITPPPIPDEPRQFDETPPEVQDALASRPSANQFASAFGATNAGAGIPGMIGDFCGLSPPLGSDAGVPVTDSPAPVAGGNCRHKFAEFTSPCPQDRFFLLYNHYENGISDVFGQQGNIDLVTLGIEKTFLHNMASIEVRVPFLSGLQSDVFFGPDTFGSEFGNVSTSLKVLLTGKRRYAVSAGTIFIWPTGADAQFFGNTIENEAIHAAPFIAWMFRPCPRIFHQAVTQVDFDLSGDTLTRNGASDNIKYQTLLYLDYSVGCWLFQNHRGPIRSMAGMIELHYTSTLEDVDLTPIGGGDFFRNDRRDILNMTGGFQMQLGRATVMRIAGGAPLRDDRGFDAEFAVQAARYF